MAFLRKVFYRKPPDGLLEISEGMYVFNSCFTTQVLDAKQFRMYLHNVVAQLQEHLPDASYMVFNFREDSSAQSQIANVLTECEMIVMDYPCQYEGCPLLTMNMIHHVLRSSESWLSLSQKNVLLMHCEAGGWSVLAFILASLLIYRKTYTGEQKTLDMIYKQSSREHLQLLSPLDPSPSQLRYLQYVSRRNVGSEWPPLDRALTLDCIILRVFPNFNDEGGCRPIIRIYGQDPFIASDQSPKVLFSTPKKSKIVQLYKQRDCELVKIDIHCHIHGDVVVECINVDKDLEREQMIFRVMFNTAFIRSNILMLNRDEIDILWDTKDKFPIDFRVEILLSDMNVGTGSFTKMELPACEDKDGLPVEAFSKAREFFSNVIFLDAVLQPDITFSICSAKNPTYDAPRPRPPPQATERLASPDCNHELLSYTTPKQPSFPSLIHNSNVLPPQGSSMEEVCLSEKMKGSSHKDTITRVVCLEHKCPLPLQPLPPPPPSPPLKKQISSTHLPSPPSLPSPPPPPPPPPKNQINSTHLPFPPPLPPPKNQINSTHLPSPPPPPSRSGTNQPSNSSSAPPPPPPGPKGQGGMQKNPISLQAPRKATLRPLHWVKVTRAMQGSLWAEAQKQAYKAPEFDMSELENLFSTAVSKSDATRGKSGKRASVSQKPEKVHLIDIRRANNCGIMLATIKMPLPDLMNSILSLDDSVLDINQVENLIKSCPTKEEMDLLKGFKGDKESLGKCEQFFLEVMKVPRMEAKLQAFSFKIQFQSQVNDLSKNLSIVNSAAEEIKNSTKLERIMQAILSLGNALNQGTARGSAIGFRLDSLLKLKDTRARNSRMTLMNYLCKVIAEKMPELLDFPDDLNCLESASKIQLKTLAEEMQSINKGIEKVEQEFAASENDGPISKTFYKNLKDFITSAVGEVRALTSQYSGVGRNADALAHYFGEDPARCPFEQVVATLINFVRLFVQAHKENLTQIELERKKAQKEAENEKSNNNGGQLMKQEGLS